MASITMLSLYCARCSRIKLGTSKYSIRNLTPRIQTVAKCSSSSTSDVKKPDIAVYYGLLTPQIKGVKIFSIATSILGLTAQPFLYIQSSNLGAPVTVAMFGFVGFFTFVTPFLLHTITKKYVTHIYYNPDTEKYSAILLNFFLREKKVTFSKDDVVVPDVPGMFTSFHVKGCAMFVDPRLFDEPTHYVKLMGYDKPLDFKLNTSDDKSEEKKKKQTQ